MSDAKGEAPEPFEPDTHDPSRPAGTAYAAWLWAMAVAGLAGALLATVTEGPLRRGAMLAIAAAALVMIWAASSPRLAPQRPQAMVGGSGYEPLIPARIMILQSAVTLFYNIGIMVVVMTALATWMGLGPQVSQAAFQASPILQGMMLVLLAAALHWRIATAGGLARTWYTRAHGALLLAYALPLLALSAMTVQSSPAVVGPWLLYESHLVVFTLMIVLGVGTQALLAAELPTIFDMAQRLVRWRPRRTEEDEAPRETPPFVYAVLAALGVAAILAFISYETGLLARFDALRGTTTVYLVLVFPLALVVFFAISAWMVWRQGRRGLYRKRMTQTARNSIMVYAASGLGGAAGLGLVAYLLLTSVPTLGPFTVTRGLMMDITALTIVITAGPIGWYLHRQNRRIDGIEERLPDFLNDLAETRRAGLTMAAALQSIARSDYGALSPDVRKMAKQVAWGVPFTEALAQFAERARTALVQRTAYLIIEASKTGGSVAQILKAAAHEAYELKSLEAERRTTMMTYVLVLYVVFAVFLLVLGVLDARFIPEVLGAAAAAEAVDSASGAPTFIQGDIDPRAVQFAYFNAAMVQAVGNGVVTGVLSESRVTAGLRHVAIMAALGWFVFRLVLGAG